MIRRERPKSTSSPNVRVGEIDTSPPFQSIKDAVNLFGKVAFSPQKPSIKQVKPHSAERVFAKETQLHLAEKDLNKLKHQLKNAENTKAEALAELEKARQTAKELAQRIGTISESKNIALKATESAKVQANQLEEANSGSISVNTVSQQKDLECVIKQYMNALEEFNSAKKELAKIHRDYDESLEVKAFANKKIEEAGLAAKVNSERAQEISKQISDAIEMTQQLRQATGEAEQGLRIVFAEKDVLRQTYKADLEELEKQLQSAKREFDPELAKNLEAGLAQTMSEIHTLEKEMENAKGSDMDTVRTVTSELDGAKESLQKVLEEESALQQLVESLKCELDDLRTKSGAKMTLSRDEYESIIRKAEESDKVAELKAAAALAQVEAVKASESEAYRKLEAAQKDTEDIKTATQEALKRAEMDEAAKKAVEGDLRRWCEREQKKASRVLTETQVANTETTRQATTAKYSPIHKKIQKQRTDMSTPAKKLERRRTSLPKKVSIPQIGGIFHRKRRQVEAGTPSYLPGENPC